MSKQTGILIKEARAAAGMTQKQLAEKVDGLSASTLGKAERGEKELTPQQLEAIAEALGVAPETLCAEEPKEAAITDEELLEMFKSADPETKKAAISALKGENPQGGEGAANPMAAMMGMFSGMMGGAGAGEGAEGAANPMAAMMGGAGEGGEGDNPMAGMMSMFSGMMGGAGAGAGEGEGGEGAANPMAAMMGMFSGMMGGAGGNKENAESAPAEQESEKKTEE